MFVKKIKIMEFIDKVASREIHLKNIIDVRETSEVRNGAIAGSKNVAMNKLLANPSQYLSKDETYYIMCQSGMRSKKVCKSLKSEYNVVNVQGGYGLYQRFK